MKIDDPNMVLYVKEGGENPSCYCARNPTSNTIEKEKVLYMFLDKFGVTYKAMKQRIAQGMTWQGLPIPKLTPKIASSIGGEYVSHRREQLRGVPIIAMPHTTSGEALSSRPHGGSVAKCTTYAKNGNALNFWTKKNMANHT